MPADDLCFQSAIELVARLRRREVSCREVMDAHLAQIARVNPHAAGTITVGKTNTPEFGAGSQTFNAVFGATRNPYDLTGTCGGSSGGAAVAERERRPQLAL